MIIDPQALATSIFASSILPPLTTSSSSSSSSHHHHSTSSSVAPVPTVIPGDNVTYQTASEVGQRTLWVVVVLMALSSLAFYAMAFRVPVQKRLFHVLTAFITTFAFLSYFAMATGDGISANKIIEKVNHKVVPPTQEIVYRDVYWARYVDWSVTTPLLLLDLCLMAGLAGANILIAIVADLIMILTGLFAAYGDSDGQKWGWYTIACIAFLVIIYQLAVNGREAVSGKDNKTKAFYGAISGFTLILWTVYPIVWGVADGARIADVDTEIIAYAVLDILAKPIFGFWLLFTHDSMSSTSPSVEGFWSQGLGSAGTITLSED